MASQTDVRTFAAAALAACATAQQRCGTAVAGLALGPHTVEVRVTGDALRDRVLAMLLPTMRNEEPAVARIHAFDSATTGVAMPAPPWGPDAYRLGFEVDGLHDGRFVGSYSVDQGVLALYDREQREAVYWARDAAPLAADQEAAPLRNLLRWIGIDLEVHMIHAAAVGTDAGGVLILGAKGAGKSTASLACLQAGLRYVGDDFCLLVGDDPWQAVPLTHTARAEEGTLDLLPGLRTRITNPDRPPGHKSELEVGDRLSSSLPVHALLAPVRRADSGAPQPVDRARFVHTVLAGTVGVFPGLAGESLALLRRLTADLPCYVLPTGPDVADAMPAAIAALLEQSVGAAA